VGVGVGVKDLRGVEGCALHGRLSTSRLIDKDGMMGCIVQYSAVTYIPARFSGGDVGMWTGVSVQRGDTLNEAWHSLTPNFDETANKSVPSLAEGVASLNAHPVYVMMRDTISGELGSLGLASAGLATSPPSPRYGYKSRVWKVLVPLGDNNILE